MKTCSRCNEAKDPVLFSKNSRNKDGLHAWCKPCFAKYEHDRYQNGDSMRKKRNLARTALANKDKLWEMLTTSSCMDCGEENPVVLEFDHREPNLKEYSITEMFTMSWARIQKEIDKCDIVCRNCHMIRTNHMFGWWRSKR